MLFGYAGIIEIGILKLGDKYPDNIVSIVKGAQG
jgi:hypothetical protein